MTVEVKIIEHNKTPPTYFVLSDFTRPYQAIVETYGIPRYKEVNPGYFTTVTFTYCFAVMFGDFGHGMALFAAALWICFNQQHFQTGMLKSVYDYRMCLVFMGFFSIYNGLIYNDFISIKLLFFNSCYDQSIDTFYDSPNNKITYHDIHKNGFSKEAGCTYPLGFDWVWGLAENEIAFMNSFKMKLSIIIGVIHMTLGILLKGMNEIYFGNICDFIFEFLPQLVFFTSTFGYMAF